MLLDTAAVFLLHQAAMMAPAPAAPRANIAASMAVPAQIPAHRVTQAFQASLLMSPMPVLATMMREQVRARTWSFRHFPILLDPLPDGHLCGASRDADSSNNRPP